ncbi:hypothetical protein Cgig2_015417 [Carnegiea gigantea]|uniref:AtTam37 zinc finger domain-containing protein n=1 Tax=Carnegiea gigantea TaxID=171969 RepID=A0A9Q1K2P6_9CARY|nr:hypothetical protein Cgig2_015417 [Carnegiea gigantea]
MPKGFNRLKKKLKILAAKHFPDLTDQYGGQLIDILEFPIKLVLSPITLAFDIAGSAPRGFGIPEFISNASYTAVFAIATLGTWDIALELGKKRLSNLQWMAGTTLYYVQRNRTGALSSDRSLLEEVGLCHVFVLFFVPRMTLDVSSLRVGEEGKQQLLIFFFWELSKQQQRERAVMNYPLLTQRDNLGSAKGISMRSEVCTAYAPQASGEKATPELVADAIANNQAELVHLPSAIALHAPLPSKDCPTCDGTGVMKCPECKSKLPFKISADDIMEPPWKAYNVLKKMDYPYEHIVHSMKDPSIAAFWLLTMPQIVDGFSFDDEVKREIWWEYKDSMRYDQLRDAVAQRRPGWENLQQGLITLDPARARDDPVVVKNVPYYKAKKALEMEVMKLSPPPRPPNWGVSIFIC